MLKLLKKYFSFSLLLSSLILAQPSELMAQQKADGSGFVDDSIKDISIVLGAGAAGAVLGLSTLSFVEEPSDHMKNIAIGGAVGIIIGVGIVIFSQATKSSSAIVGASGAQMEVPLNSEKFESLSRRDFFDYKIVQANPSITNIGYNFSF